MTDLYSSRGKHIFLTDTDGTTWSGKVVVYTSSPNNNDEGESIIVCIDKGVNMLEKGSYVEFTADEIRELTIMGD